MRPPPTIIAIILWVGLTGAPSIYGFRASNSVCRLDEKERSSLCRLAEEEDSFFLDSLVSSLTHREVGSITIFEATEGLNGVPITLGARNGYNDVEEVPLSQVLKFLSGLACGISKTSACSHRSDGTRRGKCPTIALPFLPSPTTTTTITTTTTTSITTTIQATSGGRRTVEPDCPRRLKICRQLLEDSLSRGPQDAAGRLPPSLNIKCPSSKVFITQ